MRGWKQALFLIAIAAVMMSPGAAFAQSGAFTLQQDSLDSAVLVSLNPGNYTACNSTQAIIAMPITLTNQASVRSQGRPIR